MRTESIYVDDGIVDDQDQANQTIYWRFNQLGYNGFIGFTP
jgi:hypothetical protein